MGATSSTNAVILVEQAVCPHCWHRFAPEDVLWISEHVDLLGDSLLGADQPQRFLPSRFTPAGDAVDARGQICRKLACPRCHLAVTRGLLESEPLFLSLMGAPASGKSYFLAAATWKLRETLINAFGVAFQDADPTANLALNEAENNLFHNAKPGKVHDPLNLINKTQLEGDQYDTVSYGGHAIVYPRPYLFSLQYHERHPLFGRGPLSRMLCLYDNAGEHWNPGSDSPTRPVTGHVALARVLLYVFDPTQNSKFRDAALRSRPDAPSGGGVTFRQDTILGEAAARIRRDCGLSQRDKIDRLLIVILPKFDAWSHLVADPPVDEPWISSARQPVAGFLADQVERVSAQIRELLTRHCPETIAAAEAVSNRIVYIPVSALGPDGVVDLGGGKAGIRPESVRPFWVTVPFLYAIQAAIPGLIPRVRLPGRI